MTYHIQKQIEFKATLCLLSFYIMCKLGTMFYNVRIKSNLHDQMPILLIQIQQPVSISRLLTSRTLSFRKDLRRNGGDQSKDDRQSAYHPSKAKYGSVLETRLDISQRQGHRTRDLQNHCLIIQEGQKLEVPYGFWKFQLHLTLMNNTLKSEHKI